MITVKEIITDARIRLEDTAKKIWTSDDWFYRWLEEIANFFLEIFNDKILRENLTITELTTQAEQIQYTIPTEILKINRVKYGNIYFEETSSNIEEKIDGLSHRKSYYYIIGTNLYLKLVDKTKILANGKLILEGYNKTTITDENTQLNFDKGLKDLLVISLMIKAIEKNRIDHPGYSTWQNEYKEKLVLYSSGRTS